MFKGLPCPVCSHRFKASEARCENWRDPNRSCGCPKCGTWIADSGAGKINWQRYWNVMRPVSIVAFPLILLMYWLLDDGRMIVHMLSIYGGISAYWSGKCGELFEADAASEERS